MKIWIISIAIIWGAPLLSIAILGIASIVSPRYRRHLGKSLLGDD